MKGKGRRAEKVTGRKVKGIQKSRGGLSGHYFPVSTHCSRNPLLGRDRKQSMEVIAMAFPEEHEKKL